VFCTPEVAQVVGGQCTLVPTRLVLALCVDSTYLPEAPPSYTFRPWPGRMDGFIATTHWIYANSLIQRAGYERAHGKPELARRYLALAARFDPHIRQDAIPPLPLDGNAIVQQTATVFNDVNRSLGGIGVGGKNRRE